MLDVMTPQEFTIIDLKFSIQRALIGEVTANMAAVTCALRQNLIVLRCCYFGTPTPADKERLSAVGTEVIADFPAPYEILEECVRYQPSRHLPECLGFWAFMRAEVEEQTLAASQA
jgi:hypothetical protein